MISSITTCKPNSLGLLVLVAMIKAGIAKKEALANPCKIASICIARAVLFFPALFQRCFWYS